MKFNQFVNFPILLRVEKEIEEEVPVEEKSEKEGDDVDIEKAKDEKAKDEPKTKKTKRTVQ